MCINWINSLKQRGYHKNVVSLSILYKDRTAMSLLSLDILEGKTSKYETNHIHMIVDGEISFPVTNMNLFFMSIYITYNILLQCLE